MAFANGSKYVRPESLGPVLAVTLVKVKKAGVYGEYSFLGMYGLDGLGIRDLRRGVSFCEYCDR